MLTKYKIIACIVTCMTLVWLTAEQVQLTKVKYYQLYRRVFSTETKLTELTLVEKCKLLKNNNSFAKSVSTIANSSLSQQNPSRTCVTKRMLKKEKAFLKAGNQRVYLYSAVGLNNMYTTSNYKRNKRFDYSSIVLTGWEHTSIHIKEYICCYMLTNGSVIAKISRDGRLYKRPANLLAKQYTCPVIIDKKTIEGISLRIHVNGQNCSHSKDDYLTPFFPPQHNKTTIALCSKLAYGNLTASRLVEWFEAQKLFGVTKVLAYLHNNLNDVAREVFNYYVLTGMAEVFEFDFPEKDIVQRDVGSENEQYWSDEQVVACDCQIRLHGYTYVGVIDTDEFMVPVTNTYNNSWITYLDGIFHRKEKIAFITFNVLFHATTWGSANNASKLFIGRYSNSTLAIDDRHKNIYMPSRIRIGSVDTHDITPDKGFVKYIAKTDEAVLHHYRACRQEWLKNTHNTREFIDPTRFMDKLYTIKFKQKCYDFTRHTSDIMQSIANILEPVVFNLCQQLGIKLSPYFN